MREFVDGPVDAKVRIRRGAPADVRIMVVYMVRPDGSVLGLVSCFACGSCNIVQARRWSTSCWCCQAPVVIDMVPVEEDDEPVTARYTAWEPAAYTGGR